jgi:hypothetical protein
MNKEKRVILCILILGSLLGLLQDMRSQMVIGQYEDEAPIQTWNTYGIQTAPSLGRGGTGFTLASDSSSSLLNPALLTGLEKLSICFSGGYNRASFYRYSILNTGILISALNQKIGIYSGDYIGIAGKISNWALAISLSHHENFGRPALLLKQTSGNILYYTLGFEQKGTLVNANFSLARKISEKISIGVGLNVLRGKHERSIEEEWIVSNRSISDRKSLRLNGFFVNGGIIWNPSKELALAAVFQAPYKRRADGESLYRFEAPNSNTDIQIDGSGECSFQQPMVLGLGLNFKISRDVLLAADVSYFNWNQYEVKYFEESLLRDFKNIIKLNTGIEMTTEYTFLGKDISSPLRLGFIYDPQPMRTPGSYYLGLSLGMGIKFKTVFADFAYFLGRESGSGNDLSAKKILFTISFHMGNELK